MFPLIVAGVTIGLWLAGLIAAGLAIRGYAAADTMWAHEFRAVRSGVRWMRAALILLAGAAYTCLVVRDWFGAAAFGVLWALACLAHRQHYKWLLIREASHTRRPTIGHIHRFGGWVEEVRMLRVDDGLTFRPVTPDGDPVVLRAGDVLCHEPPGPRQVVQLLLDGDYDSEEGL